MQDKSHKRNVGTWKQEKKETRTVANYNDITTKFSSSNVVVTSNDITIKQCDFNFDKQCRCN